ncbi:MAG: hypothetical protein ACOYKI_03525 [Sediminibacterium sp.]
MNLIDITKQDTILEIENGQKVHESILQSYHVVNFIYEMAERGDSSKTIVEIINLIKHLNQNKK